MKKTIEQQKIKPFDQAKVQKVSVSLKSLGSEGPLTKANKDFALSCVDKLIEGKEVPTLEEQGKNLDREICKASIEGLGTIAKDSESTIHMRQTAIQSLELLSYSTKFDTIRFSLDALKDVTLYCSEYDEFGERKKPINQITEEENIAIADKACAKLASVRGFTRETSMRKVTTLCERVIPKVHGRNLRTAFVNLLYIFQDSMDTGVAQYALKPCKEYLGVQPRRDVFIQALDEVLTQIEIPIEILEQMTEWDLPQKTKEKLDEALREEKKAWVENMNEALHELRSLCGQEDPE